MERRSNYPIEIKAKIEQDGYNPFEQFIKEGKETR